MKIYLIGSLRNPQVTSLAIEIRKLGFDVFDDWFAAGPEADDYWQKYEIDRGNRFDDGLKGYAAGHVYNFDKHHLDTAEVGILFLPAGKSGHLELGYLIGQGKPGFIFMDGLPERWDLMYKFATEVFFEKEALFKQLKNLTIL